MTFILLVFGAFASFFLTLVSLAFDFSVPEPHDGPPSRTAPAAPAPATLRKALRVRILASSRTRAREEVPTGTASTPARLLRERPGRAVTSRQTQGIS